MNKITKLGASKCRFAVTENISYTRRVLRCLKIWKNLEKTEKKKKEKSLKGNSVNINMQ